MIVKSLKWINCIWSQCDIDRVNITEITIVKSCYVGNYSRYRVYWEILL